MKQCKPETPDAAPLRHNTPVVPSELPSQSLENIWIVPLVMYDESPLFHDVVDLCLNVPPLLRHSTYSDDVVHVRYDCPLL